MVEIGCYYKIIMNNIRTYEEIRNEELILDTGILAAAAAAGGAIEGDNLEHALAEKFDVPPNAIWNSVHRLYENEVVGYSVMPREDKLYPNLGKISILKVND